MKKFVIKHNKANTLVIDKEDKFKILPIKKDFLPKRSFVGTVVYLRLPDGFKRVVKVLDTDIPIPIYYETKNLILKESKLPQLIQEQDKIEKYLGNVAIKQDSIYSNANGEFWKKLFGNKNLDNKKEFSQDEMNTMYKNTGGRMTFKEWLKSSKLKKLANNVVSLGFALFHKNKDANKPKINANDNTNDTNTNNEITNNVIQEDNKKQEVTILGMHPITFGLSSLGILIIVGLATLTFKNKWKNKK